MMETPPSQPPPSIVATRPLPLHNEEFIIHHRRQEALGAGCRDSQQGLDISPVEEGEHTSLVADRKDDGDVLLPDVEEWVLAVDLVRFTDSPDTGVKPLHQAKTMKDRGNGRV